METGANKIRIRMDGKELFVDPDATILDAAKRNGFHIPTLCHHPALSNWGGCRLCVVQVDGSPRLEAACVTPVRDGMEVVTINDYIIRARRTVLEFLFAERNHNCMFCPRSGDCELQALAYELRMDHLTVPASFHEYPVDITSEYMVLDHNRCILCGRCVRACEEIARARVLQFQNRGPRTLIGFDLNRARKDSTCLNCGVCMQVCPTGAMVNRYRSHYAVKGHAGDRKRIETVCPLCGLLCRTVSTVHEGNLLKVEGLLHVDRNRPDRGRLCHRGRFEPFKSYGRRLLGFMVRNGQEYWTETGRDQALDMLTAKLQSVREKEGAGSVFGLASGACSGEELLLFEDLMKRGYGSDQVDTLDGDAFRAYESARRELGFSYGEASWRRLVEFDFVLFVGALSFRTQPLVISLVRQSVLERGVNAAFIGTPEVPFPYSSLILPVDMNDRATVLQAFLKETVKSTLPTPGTILPRDQILEAEKADTAVLLNRARLDEDGQKVFRAMVAGYCASKNPCVIMGVDMNTPPSAAWVKSALLLALWKGPLEQNTARFIFLKPYGNSSGAWKLGLASDAAACKRKKWRAGVLLLSGSEPPESSPLEEIGRPDFLAVIGPWFPDALKGKAHLLIPKPCLLEEEGTFRSLDGFERSYKSKILSPPDGVEGLFELYMALSRRLGFKPGFETWDELRLQAGD